MGNGTLSCKFTWSLQVLFGLSRGASVPSSCRRCLDSPPIIEEWGPAWLWLSWTRLGGADHRSEALKKCYKEGVPFPIGPALSAQQSDTNCSGSCFFFPFSHHPHWCPARTCGERWKAALPTAWVIVCSLEGGCPAEAGVCSLAVEPCIEATVGPGHPGST